MEVNVEDIEKRLKRRAIELYAKNTPFRHREERVRIRYNRKIKHKQNVVQYN